MDFRFIDSHVHFWDPARLRYPWLEQVPALAGPHTPSELASELAASGSTGAGRALQPEQMVFVQAECERNRFYDELEWVEELTAREPRITAVVAFAPMDRGAQTAAALDRLRGSRLVRGIRHLIQGESAPDFCYRAEFVAGVRRAGELGWTFDLCLGADQLPAATELVRRCPGTQFVLDHGGKPPIRRGLLDPWRGEIESLAALPNVVCKFSGLVTEADPARWSLDALRPYADHLVDCFGPNRLLFGSDWPVVVLAGGYQRWLAAARALAERLSSDERDAIFFGSARRVYRLP